MVRLNGRVRSLERRTGDAGPCRVCGGAGYPGLFLRRGAEGPLRRVGEGGCPGCGRVYVGKVIELDGPAAEEFAGGGGAETSSP